MKELGIPFRSENIRAKRISYNPSIYESLGLPEEEPVWKVSLLRIVDGAPAAVYTRYLPERYFPHLPEDAGFILSFHAYLPVKLNSASGKCPVSQKGRPRTFLLSLKGNNEKTCL